MKYIKLFLLCMCGFLTLLPNELYSTNINRANSIVSKGGGTVK